MQNKIPTTPHIKAQRSAPYASYAHRFNFLFILLIVVPAALGIRTSGPPKHRPSPSTLLHTLLYTFSNPTQTHQKCLQKLRRNPPPPERPPLAKLPPRRRRPERRPPPLPRATRRSAPRPERRPTRPTSTKSSNKCIPTLVSPTKPCQSSTHLVRSLSSPSCC